MSLVDSLPKVRGEYRYNFPLNKANWFNVGGLAEVLFKPKDIEDLISFMNDRPRDIDITVLGVGSNVIIRDGGIDGVILKLGRAFAGAEIFDGNFVRAGSSCLNYNLAHLCAENSLSGLEFLVGIPGSIGGGIAMNAGAYGFEFKDFLVEVKAVDMQGKMHILSNKDFGFIYRGNSLKKQMIFTEAVFELKNGNKDDILEKMSVINKKRENTQPIYDKTTGSTFANPEGYAAWKLIDDAGLRGFKIGGASMSTKHCNFMINDGTATARDLEDLGEYVRKKVYMNSAITLEWEVKRIGKKV